MANSLLDAQHPVKATCSTKAQKRAERQTILIIQKQDTPLRTMKVLTAMVH